MKLGPVLASFLYQHRRLDLPGIGSFLIDQNQVTEGGKHIIHGITFETNLAAKEDPQLINFISEQTGKMKALASADFNSYLQTALQFLNIGKPFLFEGIGSLVKKKAGGFAFAPAEQPQQAGEYSAREISATASSEESFHAGPEPGLRINGKKILLVLLIIASLGIVVWGGYALYQRTTRGNKTTPANLQKTRVPMPVHRDTSLRASRTDSLKYILETSERARAMVRYEQLRSYGWNVRIEQVDTIRSQVYLLLHAAVDSSRARDSLSLLTGRPVVIGQ